MSVSDPIADMLTRIRNAGTARKDRVVMPLSKVKLALAEVLEREGFIDSYSVVGEGVAKSLEIRLRYGANKERAIAGIKRMSRPGLRVYAQADQIPRVLGGLGVAVLSTSRGLMTDKEARRRRVGGEVLCYVW
jgi:small subunit ribosomal protein S8